MKKFSVSELKQLISEDRFPAIVPLLAAAEMLNMSKAGLLRRAATASSCLELISYTSESGTTWNGVSIESLKAELNDKENHIPNTSKSALEYLQLLAKQEETAFYGDFMGRVGLTWRNPQHRGLIGRIGGNISKVMWHHHKIMPSVLIVNKATGRPSGPFFDLAESLGAYDPGSQSEEAFFEKMRDKVFKAAARAGAWGWRNEYGILD